MPWNHQPSHPQIVFAVRDIVRHVGGGPDMFVEGPGTSEGQVWCSWFNGQFHHAGSFNQRLLIRVTSREKADVTLIGDPKMHF